MESPLPLREGDRGRGIIVAIESQLA